MRVVLKWEMDGEITLNYWNQGRTTVRDGRSLLFLQTFSKVGKFGQNWLLVGNISKARRILFSYQFQKYSSVGNISNHWPFVFFLVFFFTYQFLIYSENFKISVGKITFYTPTTTHTRENVMLSTSLFEIGKPTNLCSDASSIFLFFQVNFAHPKSDQI